MPLSALVGKKLTLFGCTNVIKWPPPSSPPNPSETSISELPSVTPSATTSNYDGDVEMEVSSPDFSSFYTSSRFFVSSPGLSSSILECSPSSAIDVVDEGECVKGEVEVQKESPDPYSDFRRSMEEMVEARELHDVPAHWGSLRELLRRYLSLNAEPNHKFIAGAFADLLLSLMMADESGF